MVWILCWSWRGSRVTGRFCKNSGDKILFENSWLKPLIGKRASTFETQKKIWEHSIKVLNFNDRMKLWNSFGPTLEINTHTWETWKKHRERTDQSDRSLKLCCWTIKQSDLLYCGACSQIIIKSQQVPNKENSTLLSTWWGKFIL